MTNRSPSPPTPFCQRPPAAPPINVLWSRERRKGNWLGRWGAPRAKPTGVRGTLCHDIFCPVPFPASPSGLHREMFGAWGGRTDKDSDHDHASSKPWGPKGLLISEPRFFPPVTWDFSRAALGKRPFSGIRFKMAICPVVRENFPVEGIANRGSPHLWH